MSAWIMPRTANEYTAAKRVCHGGPGLYLRLAQLPDMDAEMDLLDDSLTAHEIAVEHGLELDNA